MVAVFPRRSQPPSQTSAHGKLRFHTDSMLPIDRIAPLMAAYEHSPDAQLSQTRFRAVIADRWSIREGMRPLEIGCGQGDMTAVLANAVGAQGHITAIDRAEPDYGSPVTLDESARRIKASELGERVDFQFGFDVLDPENEFERSAFDGVVFSHCAWYFRSPSELSQTLGRVRDCGNRLFFAEWDLVPTSIEQIGHYIAVAAQAELVRRNRHRESNVRTPLSARALRRLITECGWSLEIEALVDSSQLDDGKWEIAACRDALRSELSRTDPSSETSNWLGSQLDVLECVAERGHDRSLGTVLWVAQRRPTDLEA